MKYKFDCFDTMFWVPRNGIGGNGRNPKQGDIITDRGNPHRFEITGYGYEAYGLYYLLVRNVDYKE